MFPTEESKQTEIDKLLINGETDDAAEDEDLLARLVEMILLKRYGE